MKKFSEVVINLIKWAILAYFLIFLPYMLFGLKIGAAITFGIIVVWVLYEANARHHNKRELYLKDLLRSSGWNEKVIDHGLKKIDDEQNNH